MNKQTIIKTITEKYQLFTQFVGGLNAEDYHFSYQNKWTAGQQLQHMILCTKSLSKAFAMGVPLIIQNFGQTERAGLSQEKLSSLYTEQLLAGGKAPERFVPGPAAPDDANRDTATLTALIKDLCSGIESLSEQELDSLLIPHPLLDKLTLREMLYNAITHVEHHHEQTKQNLEHK
ncbi:MAG TPA: DinB family protein [Bacteroidia bacterium]|nr:DinB family protein [Bacteroidia bacterium]